MRLQYSLSHQTICLSGKPLSPSSVLASVYFDAAAKATLPSASQAALGIAAAIAAVDGQDVIGDIQFFTSLTTHQPPQQQQQQQQKSAPQQQPWQSDVQQMFTMGSPSSTPPPSVSDLMLMGLENTAPGHPCWSEWSAISCVRLEFSHVFSVSSGVPVQVQVLRV